MHDRVTSLPSGTVTFLRCPMKLGSEWRPPFCDEPAARKVIENACYYRGQKHLKMHSHLLFPTLATEIESEKLARTAARLNPSRTISTRSSPFYGHPSCQRVGTYTSERDHLISIVDPTQLGLLFQLPFQLAVVSLSVSQCLPR